MFSEVHNGETFNDEGDEAVWVKRSTSLASVKASNCLKVDSWHWFWPSEHVTKACTKSLISKADAEKD